MAKPTAQQCHALTTYFMAGVKEATNRTPVVNRNKARWGFEAVLMDYTQSDARELIDYYLKKYERPSLEWFLFNYDKVENSKRESEDESRRRAERRKATQEKLEQWRNRWNQ